MLKRNLIALCVSFTLGLFFLLAAGPHSPAMASAGDGYEPLFWNGPPGYDYNVLFDRPNKYLVYRQNRCNYFGRKYLKTGRRHWLRKYRVCKALSQ